jgi:hypothetical protein
MDRLLYNDDRLLRRELAKEILKMHSHLRNLLLRALAELARQDGYLPDEYYEQNESTIDDSLRNEIAESFKEL